MKLVLDNREKKLYEECNKLITTVDTFKNIIIDVQALEIGDIIIRDDEDAELVIIERKSIPDLIASIKDKRYSEQSYRLNGYDFPNHNIVYLIEGSCKSLTREKQMVYSSMVSINYYKGFSVFKSENISESAYYICNMFAKIEKEKGKKPYSCKGSGGAVLETDESYCSFVKKKKNENITVDNFGEIVLSQIPGVSSVTAVAIMKEFKTLNNLIEKLKADSSCLNDLKYETEKKQLRRINKTSIANILKFLIN
jgi:ERCC4-type nuclease